MNGDQPAEAFCQANASSLDDPISSTVFQVYRRAGLVPGGLGPVSPLRQLVAASGLVVDEIRGLSRAVAAQYLEEHGGPSVPSGAQNGEPLAGFLYANAAGGWILTELGHPLARRRFTIAHETAHYFLHFLPALETAADRSALELREELSGVTDAGTEPVRSEGQIILNGLSSWQEPVGTASEQMEEEADWFAAALLLPAEIMRELVAKHTVRCGGRRTILVRLMAGECLVSAAAMSRRLDELGLGRPEARAEVGK
jgi:hypothetical protein